MRRRARHDGFWYLVLCLLALPALAQRIIPNAFEVVAPGVELILGPISPLGSGKNQQPLAPDAHRREVPARPQKSIALLVDVNPARSLPLRHA
jgi:hypothetical protein